MHGPLKVLPIVTPKHNLQMVTVTPEMATELLERNGHNRPLSEAHVQRIAGQIRAGKWRFNGDTIKIADTMDVLDGQHRLWAVIEARKPIDTILVYGIAKDAFATIDTMRKTRSGSDILSLIGVDRHAKYTAEGLKWLLRWQRKTLTEYRAPKNRIENSDVEEAFHNHPKMVNAVDRVIKIRRIANPSIMSFLYYVFYSQNAELAEQMIYTLENPERIALSDPFFRLRSYFTADHLSHKDPLMTIALTIKAANAAKQGKKIDRLYWRSQGDKPEPFPGLSI